MRAADGRPVPRPPGGWRGRVPRDTCPFAPGFPPGRGIERSRSRRVFGIAGPASTPRFRAARCRVGTVRRAARCCGQRRRTGPVAQQEARSDGRDRFEREAKLARLGFGLDPLDELEVGLLGRRDRPCGRSCRCRQLGNTPRPAAWLNSPQSSSQAAETHRRI